MLQHTQTQPSIDMHVFLHTYEAINRSMPEAPLYDTHTQNQQALPADKSVAKSALQSAPRPIAIVVHGRMANFFDITTAV